jgi:hypothetical protein
MEEKAASAQKRFDELSLSLSSSLSGGGGATDLSGAVEVLKAEIAELTRQIESMENEKKKILMQCKVGRGGSGDGNGCMYYQKNNLSNGGITELVCIYNICYSIKIQI